MKVFMNGSGNFYAAEVPRNSSDCEKPFPSAAMLSVLQLPEVAGVPLGQEAVDAVILVKEYGLDAAATGVTNNA